MRVPWPLRINDRQDSCSVCSANLRKIGFVWQDRTNPNFTSDFPCPSGGIPLGRLYEHRGRNRCNPAVAAIVLSARPFAIILLAALVRHARSLSLSPSFGPRLERTNESRMRAFVLRFARAVIRTRLFFAIPKAESSDVSAVPNCAMSVENE